VTFERIIDIMNIHDVLRVRETVTSLAVAHELFAYSQTNLRINQWRSQRGGGWGVQTPSIVKGPVIFTA